MSALPERPLSPAARAAAKLGILGGSFDPVHAGHLHVARAARAAFALDHVVFVPAARSPFKPQRTRASDAERLAMLELALDGEPAASIWDAELLRPPPSFTIDTLRELARLRGHERGLHLLVGSDNLALLQEWKGAKEILALAQPVCVLRPGAARDALERLRASTEPGAFAHLERGFVERTPVGVSSTELRDRLARGEDPGDAVPPRLREYLREHAVYRPSR